MPQQNIKEGDRQVSQAQRSPAAKATIDIHMTRFDFHAGTADITPTLAYVSPARVRHWLAELPFVLTKQNSTPSALAQEPHGL